MHRGRLLLFLLLFFYNSLSGQGIESKRITEQFKDTPLTQVIRKLKNDYQVNISYDDALVAGIYITGKYNNTPLINFLNSILSNKGIQYQVIGNNNIILTAQRISLDVNKSLVNTSVLGVVQDALTGESLPNAFIKVEGDFRGTTSNKDGFFKLTDLPSDTSTLEVRYLGYESARIKLNPDKLKKTLKINMVESAMELSSFEVVETVSNAAKYGTGIAQVTVNPKALTSLPNLGELDIFQTLQLLPGISGTDETSSSLAIRSSPASHNLTLFDGFTIYKLDHFFGVFSAINSDAVRDIQVLKGGFGATYGNRISGVVDITGNTGSFLEPNLSFGLNLLSTKANFNMPYAKGRGALHFNYRLAYTNIIRGGLFNKLYNNYRDQSTLIPDQANTELIRPDFSFYDLNLKSSYRLSLKDYVSFSLYNGRDNLESDVELIERDEDDRNIILQRTEIEETAEWGNRGIGLSWSRNWNSKFYSRLQVAQSDHFLNYFFRNQVFDASNNSMELYRLTRDNEVKDIQVNLLNEISLFKKHRLKTGFNYSSLTIQNNSVIENEEGFNDWVFDPNQNGSTLGLYLEDNIAVTDKIELSAGIRYNLNDISDNHFLTPRLSLKYFLKPNIEFKAAYGQYVQLLQNVVLDDPLTNPQYGWFLSSSEQQGSNTPSIDVLTSNHYIAGFQFKKEQFVFDVEYFRKENEGINEFLVSHMINSNNQLTPEVTFSAGSEVINGVDFLLQQSYGNYTGWLSYSYSKANSQFSGINMGDQIPSRLDQRHEVKFVHMINTPQWKLSGTWIYGSGRPFLAPTIRILSDRNGNLTNYEIDNTTRQIERLPAYHRLDLSAAVKLDYQIMRAEIGLSILNIYNRTNVQSRRLKVDLLDQAINGGNSDIPNDLYRDIVLLDITPSLFINIFF